MAAFNLELEDELDFVPGTKSASTNSHTAWDDDDDAAPAASSTPPPPPTTIDWGSAVPVSQSDGLDRIAPKDSDSVTRLAVLQGFPLHRGNVHWVALAGKGKRMFRCSGPSCAACRQGDQAKDTFVTLAAQYTNADPQTGKLPEDQKPQYKIGYLSLSVSAFNDMVRAPSEGEKPTDVDYAMGRAAGPAGKFVFRVAAHKARHSRLNDTAMLLNMAKPYEALLPNKLGSPLPPNAVLAVTPPLAPGGPTRF
jgi:hypothetical protein